MTLDYVARPSVSVPQVLPLAGTHSAVKHVVAEMGGDVPSRQVQNCVGNGSGLSHNRGVIDPKRLVDAEVGDPREKAIFGEADPACRICGDRPENLDQLLVVTVADGKLLGWSGPTDFVDYCRYNLPVVPDNAVICAVEYGGVRVEVDGGHDLGLSDAEHVLS